MVYNSRVTYIYIVVSLSFLLEKFYSYAFERMVKTFILMAGG